MTPLFSRLCCAGWSAEAVTMLDYSDDYTAKAFLTRRSYFLIFLKCGKRAELNLYTASCVSNERQQMQSNRIRSVLGLFQVQTQM